MECGQPSQFERIVFTERVLSIFTFEVLGVVLRPTQKPTSLQSRITKALSINISNDSQAVAAARIRQHIAPAIGEKAYNNEPATRRQIEFAETLGINLSQDTKGIAAARIAEELNLRNMKALHRLSLKPGDLVRRIHAGEINGEKYEY